MYTPSHDAACSSRTLCDSWCVFCEPLILMSQWKASFGLERHARVVLSANALEMRGGCRNVSYPTRVSESTAFRAFFS